MAEVRFSAYDRYLLSTRYVRALSDPAWGFREVERGERARVIDLMLSRVSQADLARLWLDLYGVPLNPRIRPQELAESLKRAARDAPVRLHVWRREEPRRAPIELEMPELEYSSPLADPARLWIEWCLKDDQDELLTGLAFTQTGPDGAVRSGRTDQKGKARFEPIPAGNYVFAVPEQEPKEADETQWLDIELVDERGDPDPGRHFEVYVNDALQRSGTLDEHGHAHVTNLPLGECKVVILPIEPHDESDATTGEEDAKERGNWIEIVALDPEGEPYRHHAYVLTLPDGTKRHGVLDGDGKLCEEHIPSAGECYLTVEGLVGDWQLSDHALA